jgi:hypothetical protein
LFNAVSGARVPVSNASGDHLGDQVLLGLFYVVEDEGDPTQPAIPVQATLGQGIRLLGYSLLSDPLTLSPEGETTLSLKIYWQASQSVDGDYTMFVQLLNSRNQLITGYDTRPVKGTYPTSLWQMDEVIVEAIDLSLPTQMEAGEYRLVTGMYDFATGQRLAATDSDGQPLGDNMVELSKVNVSAGQVTLAR